MDLPVTTPMLTLFNTQTIHVEVSSKCTLKCPRCPRTELKPNHLHQDFSLSEFKTAFDATTLADIDKIVFCGDIGDPIYATELIPICRYLKDHDIDVVIVTNGSYKNTDWWVNLGSVLTARDRVTFSVDGWDQDSNNLYRVNSNFDSIIKGIKALRSTSSCRIMWSCIYFSFNEDNIDKIRAVAEDAGCDEIRFVASSKFDGDYAINGVDPLKPLHPVHFVSSGKNYKKQSLVITTEETTEVTEVKKCHPWAKCLNWQKEPFVSVEGLVFPCPWFNSGYQNNDFVQKYKDRLNIKLRSLVEVLNDPMWDEFVKSLNSVPLDVCRIKCKNDN